MCKLCANFYQVKRGLKAHWIESYHIWKSEKLWPQCVSNSRQFSCSYEWKKTKSLPFYRLSYLGFVVHFVDVFKTKECTYVCMYYIKKRLFIQKPICEVYLQLKLCLMNCFIKKLTHYQFDWGKASLYISLYVLTIWSLAHLLGWANKDLRLI